MYTSRLSFQESVCRTRAPPGSSSFTSQQMMNGTESLSLPLITMRSLDMAYHNQFSFTNTPSALPSLPLGAGQSPPARDSAAPSSATPKPKAVGERPGSPSYFGQTQGSRPASGQDTHPSHPRPTGERPGSPSYFGYGKQIERADRHEY